MPTPASDQSRGTRGPGWLNSVLGMLGVFLAMGIVFREGMESNAERGLAARSSNLAVLRLKATPVFSLGWSPDGQKLAASGFGPVVRIWKVGSGTARTIENRGNDPRFVLGWSDDGDRLILGGLNVPVESWNLVGESDYESEILVQPEDRSNMAKVMAASTRGKACRLWGPADGRLRLLPASSSAPNSIAFSPDGRFMATGEAFGAVRLWDLRSGEVLWMRSTDPRGVNSVAFSADGSKLASAGGGPIRVWDVASGREIAKLGKASGGSATVTFAPDGRRIAGAAWDGSIRIWDLATQREQTRVQGHFGQVLVLAWSPDGKTLASGGYDSTVRLWDVAEPTEVALAN
jgi:WD40 repeat protein